MVFEGCVRGWLLLRGRSKGEMSGLMQSMWFVWWRYSRIPSRRLIGGMNELSMYLDRRRVSIVRSRRSFSAPAYSNPHYNKNQLPEPLLSPSWKCPSDTDRERWFI